MHAQLWSVYDNKSFVHLGSFHKQYVAMDGVNVSVLEDAQQEDLADRISSFESATRIGQTNVKVDSCLRNLLLSKATFFYRLKGNFIY